MKVRELINELQKYPKERRILIYAHGSCVVEEQDEILGCYEGEIYDIDGNVIEKVVSLYVH